MPPALETWHFAPPEGLRDGTPLPPKGSVLSVEGPLSIMVRGFHGCRNATLALMRAQGTLVARIRLSGEVLLGLAQECGRVRETLTDYVDAGPLIEQYADELGRHPGESGRWAVIRHAHRRGGEAVNAEFERRLGELLKGVHA